MPAANEQPDQAGESMPGWVAKRIARARECHAAEPYTQGQDPLSMLWLADALAASQARAEAMREVVERADAWERAYSRTYREYFENATKERFELGAAVVRYRATMYEQMDSADAPEDRK